MHKAYFVRFGNMPLGGVHPALETDKMQAILFVSYKMLSDKFDKYVTKC